MNDTDRKNLLTILEKPAVKGVMTLDRPLLWFGFPRLLRSDDEPELESPATAMVASVGPDQRRKYPFEDVAQSGPIHLIRKTAGA